MSTNQLPENNEMQSEQTMPADQATDAAFADANEERSDSIGQLQRLNDEVKAANDRTLRAQAELENFRKRMRREMDEDRRYASTSLISDLLPVIDNLDRAIEASEGNAATEGLLTGVKMVQTQFLSVLERNQCRRLGTVGETFDPSRHQAIAQEPSESQPPGTVTRVTQHGYQLHDRVIRPAQVFVSTGSPESKPA